MVHYTETSGVSSVLNKKVFIACFILQSVAIGWVWYDSMERDGSIIWQTAKILADHQAQLKKLEKPFI
jgi:endo-beta-N-acetylglucosaminidase D